MNKLSVKTMAEYFAEGKNPDILYWVGSAGSFDDRAKKITKAFVEIMNMAQIDFGVLGTEESASGDIAKRAGNEFLFQMQALMNIQLLNSYNIKHIVTTCPHDYNTIKNEYSGLGGKYNVLHHTEFIYQLIKNKRLKLDSNFKNSVITYHDPCYLGRGNDIFDVPRKLLKKIGFNLVEMPRSKKKSFCCGAGGAQMFKEPEKGNQDININRTEEALKTIDIFHKKNTSKAGIKKIITTACPFCNTMMTDGVKNKNKEFEVQVLDIVEVIQEAKKNTL
mgnify:CR=1 FL=1